MNKLEMHHFKAFNDTLPTILENTDSKNILLYGENGSGKSSIFEALRYVFFKSIIEKVDPMLPQASQNAEIDAIRNKYNSNQGGVPFSLKINDQDVSSFLSHDYQAFFLNHFECMDSISFSNILNHLPMPCTNMEQFIDENWSFIKDTVNLALETQFYEPYEITVGDKVGGYVIGIKNKLSGFSRSTELNKFFNEAIINLIQILIWFSSTQLMFDTNKKRLIVLDDFITSLDSINRTYLVRYLIDIFSNEQLIILTHDFSFFNITSYVIQDIKKEENKWSFLKLYQIGKEHRLVPVCRTKVKALENEFQSPTCNLNDIGNKVRKCFEEALHELASLLAIGNIEETCNIINRISENKEIYWKSQKSLHDLIAQIEKALDTTSNTQIKNKVKNLISGYKIPDAVVLKDTICKLKLYQKVSMHPLSHGVLGLPHYQQKDIEQSLILLKKLEGCIKSIKSKI